MELFNDWITRINDLLWGYLLIAALLCCAVWFTLRTRGVQFRMLREMIRVLGESPGSAPRGERHISSFQAFAPRRHGQPRGRRHGDRHRRPGRRLLDVDHRPAGCRERLR